jgi:hypothetical protein
MGRTVAPTVKSYAYLDVSQVANRAGAATPLGIHTRDTGLLHVSKSRMRISRSSKRDSFLVRL